MTQFFSLGRDEESKMNSEDFEEGAARALPTQNVTNTMTTAPHSSN